MTTTETLLIEIGTEELPPHHLGRLSQAFANNLGQAFSALGIAHDHAEDFAAPRRLAVRFHGVPSVQPSRIIQKRGPASSAAYNPQGHPSQAALGFARSCGVDFEQLTIQETPQGSWLLFEHQEPGKPLVEILPTLIEEALKNLPVAKRMRWGNEDIEFLRPIHWITAMHGKQPLPIRVFGLTASNKTRGHRVHAPQEITLNHAEDYLNRLRNAKVIADHRERQAFIERSVKALAEENGGTAVIATELLDEVTGLVEWPVPMFAHFDPAFLEVPPEALISSMQNHQKSFAIKSPEGELLPSFILISNIESALPGNVIRGNERVMQARLADAKFFYDQDRKSTLESRLERLKNMIFQKKLGSLYEKSLRVSKLAGFVAKQISAPVRLSERAGKLCKADLITEMVFEFPELQGIMGSYYARYDGEPNEVAQAIQESYLPRFSKDILPETPTGICVALADRLDTLIGIFGIGQIPTGDKDPYGLRRQALAILRIIIEKALPLDKNSLCESARHGYGGLIDEEMITDVMDFCFDRFKAYYQEQGISPQVIEAVMTNPITQPFDASLRVKAVNHFQTLPEALALASANKRVKNILQKSGIQIGISRLLPIDRNLLKEKAEIALANAIDALKKQTDPLISEGRYQEALSALASLRQVVDTFFDEVLVMTEDEKLKQNRINLLSHLYALFMQIADISKLAL
ncbi:MAG: glycine--tRNA ligase subunit beta [Candidatus Berkiellales bacterium]